MREFNDAPTGKWSTSRAFDRGDRFDDALLLYSRARGAAIEAETPTAEQLDAWGAAIDRVVGTWALTSMDLAAKVRVMIMEGRGGEGCLTAILEDLDRMLPVGFTPAGGKAVGNA